MNQNRSVTHNRSTSNTEAERDIIKHSYRQNDVREIFNEIEGIVKNQRENLKSYQINNSPRLRSEFFINFYFESPKI